MRSWCWLLWLGPLEKKSTLGGHGVLEIFFFLDDGRRRESLRFGSSTLVWLVFKASFWEATNLNLGSENPWFNCWKLVVDSDFCWNFMEFLALKDGERGFHVLADILLIWG